VLYLDASALVKKYVDEGDEGTQAMKDITREAGAWGGLVSSEWLILEVASALTRKQRGGTISSSDFRRLIGRFREEVTALSLVTIGKGMPSAASRLMEDVQGVSRFHAGDAIHLYTAELLRARTEPGDAFVFAAADEGLLAVARSRRMPVFDPRTDSIETLRNTFQN
jgi:predicted nucleic acid-binding protein